MGNCFKHVTGRIGQQWRFYVGARGHRPPKSCPGLSPSPPQFLVTVVLLLVELIGSIVISLKFCSAVVASQMMRGQPPQIFFLEPPLLDSYEQRSEYVIENLLQAPMHSALPV